MSHPQIKHVCVAPLLALTMFAALALPARAAPKPPVEAFFQNVELGAAEISPNGRYVVARSSGKGARSSLVLFDLASMTPKVLARFSNGDVGAVSWLNDKRIAFTVVHIERGADATTSALYAIDLEGKRSVTLTRTVGRQRSFADNENLLNIATGRDEIRANGPASSDSTPVRLVNGGVTDMAMLDTRTAETTIISAPAGSVGWLFDDAGLLRVTVARDGDLHSVYLLDAQHNWRKLSSFVPQSAAALYPKAYIGNTLYVQARNVSGHSSLFRYDVERGALAQPALIDSPEFDIDAMAINEGKHLLGFRVNTDAESTVWFDPTMKALQAEIDALLPATVNRIDRGAHSETPFVLVRTYSPIHPGDTLVFNRDTRKFTRLGTSLPGIVPEQMSSPLAMLRYKARDGMSIPVQVTLPKGEQQKMLPTIVLVPAYPWARNSAWAFDPVVQFLVSRGYAVVQPQTRGRNGLGLAHSNAGLRQWGLAMQDDLADSAKWAIAQGIADPKRICIAGTVYGGYAATMGLIKDPELFRCGVSWAGIVDLGLMFRHYWGAHSTGDDGTALKLLVGDPAKDQAQFDATSPLKNAQRITHPVLLAYGAKDEVVPGADGRLLYEAVKPGNPDAEWIMFDEKGQPPSLEKNRAELWTRIEQFLERHIGKPPGSQL